MGVSNLLLMSLGTGYAPVTIKAGEAKDYTLLSWAGYVLKELMNEANLEQNVLMSLIGERPVHASGASAGAAISTAPSGTPSESALTHTSAGLGTRKLLTYQRVTVELTRQRLDDLTKETDICLDNVDPTKVRELDAVDQIPNMQLVGEAVAKEQVHMERLISFFR